MAQDFLLDTSIMILDICRNALARVRSRYASAIWLSAAYHDPWWDPPAGKGFILDCHADMRSGLSHP
jgi:hypothetical protein